MGTETVTEVQVALTVEDAVSLMHIASAMAGQAYGVPMSVTKADALGLLAISAKVATAMTADRKGTA